MSISISHPNHTLRGEINLTASKSESNRALIIRALCEEDFEINSLAEAEDTKVLTQLLNSQENELNVGLAGTAMRFLTALLATREGRKVVLTGEHRMKERPIKILVEALQQLGADIEYTEKEGYPPLAINGKELSGGKLILDGSVSSQYVSALLMIALMLKEGLSIEFIGEVISKPYIDMTINMMQYFGADVKWVENTIEIKEGKYHPKEFTVEADWSAASYWYSFAALANEVEITLHGLKEDSLQGDSAVVDIYKNFGVETEFIERGVRLTKISHSEFEEELNVDFTNCPDIAQTVAVTCAALNIKALLTGLKTLRIKETDRITALQMELNKLGFNVEVEGDDLLINPVEKIGWKNAQVKTYNDHRMAMAFAPLSLLNEITIEDAEVVRKSYPKFWEDIKSANRLL